MSQHVDKDNPNPIEWQAAVLRLTAFPLNPIEFTESSWWEDMVGETPDSKNSQPKTGKLKVVGQFEKGKLALHIEPTRIDWFYTNEENPVGSFLDSLDVFSPLMLRWFEICPPIKRLAFGAILVMPVEDRKAGYLQLSRYLPSLTLDPEGSSDFLYQINRPRELSTDGFKIKINRLTKWSVAWLQDVLLEVSPESAAYRIRSDQFLCTVEMDINTDKDFEDELPKERLSQIFHKLVDLGKEIAQEGDIK